jgi:Flp pilus assembly protein TadD
MKTIQRTPCSMTIPRWKQTLTLMLLTALLFLGGCAGMTGNTRTSTIESGLDQEQLERLGDAHMSQGRLEQAFVSYGKVLSLNPDNHGVRLKKGNILLQRSLVEEALGEIGEVLKHAPDHPGASVAAGEAYLRSDLLREAESHLRRAALADPGLWRAHALLGIIHNREKEYNLAEAALRTALTLKPEAGEIQNNLGLTLAATGRGEEAAAAFQEAMRHGAVSQKTCNNLGLALSRLERFNEALDAFRCGGGDEARAAAYNNVGFFLFLSGNHQKAVGYFERALEASPSYYARADENLKRTQLALEYGAGGGNTAQASAPAQSLPQPRAQAATTTPLKSVPVAWNNAPKTLSASTASVTLASTAPAPAHSRSAAMSATASATASAATNAIVPVVYGIHLSSFKTEAEAERSRARLEARGVRVQVVRAHLKNKGAWLRVVAGPFTDNAVAHKEKERLLQVLKLKYARVVRLMGGETPHTAIKGSLTI